MTNPIQTLLAFHSTRNFGSREDMIARQREAGAIYAHLTPEEQAELIEAVLAQARYENHWIENVLCCLACFQPGSLTPFRENLIRRRILYPGVIYHGAGSETAVELMALLDEAAHRNLTLVALAWIGDKTVQGAFKEWRERPPRWASELYVPPDRYSYEAGWELTQEASRRDLFHKTAFPLDSPRAARSSNGRVQTGVENNKNCPWCGHRLTALLSFENLGEYIPEHGSDPVLVLTCYVCTCFGTVLAKRKDAGETVWHEANIKPDYLPPDTSDRDAFPNSPLVLSGETRHYLQAANWSMLPGVAFSQVGGMATWIQEAKYPSCPDCSSRCRSSAS